MRRLFDIKDAKVIMTTPDAQILVDEDTGTVFFRYRNAGIAFNPKVGAWSAPLDFGNAAIPAEHLLFLDKPLVGYIGDPLMLGSVLKNSEVREFPFENLNHPFPIFHVSARVNEHLSDAFEFFRRTIFDLLNGIEKEKEKK